MNPLMESITVSRLIKAERAHVFDAFSRSEALLQWFSPSADISLELLEFEFVPQGNFRIRYTMPDGSNSVVSGTYEIIEQPVKIVFSWMWEAPDPYANISTRVFVQFFEKGEQTEVVITHDKLPSKEDCARYMAGWEGTLDRLEHALASNILKKSTGTA